MFKAGGKAEIIRSQQKDEYYLTYLRGLTADVVHNLFGMLNEPLLMLIL